MAAPRIAHPGGRLVSRFATTRWSLILRAASHDDAEARLALALLCEAYWFPVYAFIRRGGASAADAEDLTQAYFARFLEKRVVGEVRREAGRFRSFLLVSVRNFLSNERDRERALKRGGGRRLVSLDAARAEERLEEEPRDPRTPESVFERSWAESVLHRVHERLAEEGRRRGAGERFERLRPFLLEGGPGPRFDEVARDWGVGEPAVRVALHRLKKRFGEVLREEVGRTVASRAEIDAEIRYLFQVLRG
jgi:RNA polymerase sigma-70 factor (ECF subfamily)